MARPSSATFLGGEIIMKNIPKDKVELIREMLAKLETHQITVEEIIPIAAPSGVLTDTAIGLNKNSSGQYELAVLRYNPSTKEALVESLEPAGDSLALARGRFKVKVVDLDIV